MQVGFTKLDQPMIYSCLAMARDRDVAANREHMLVTFEQVTATQRPLWRSASPFDGHWECHRGTGFEASAEQVQPAIET